MKTKFEKWRSDIDSDVTFKQSFLATDVVIMKFDKHTYFYTNSEDLIKMYANRAGVSPDAIPEYFGYGIPSNFDVEIIDEHSLKGTIANIGAFLRCADSIEASGSDTVMFEDENVFELLDDSYSELRLIGIELVEEVK